MILIRKPWHVSGQNLEMIRYEKKTSFAFSFLTNLVQKLCRLKYIYSLQVLESIWNVFVAQKEEREQAITPAHEHLKFIEEQLKDKKFFHGETIGYLDIAFGWMANLLSILEEIISFKLVDAERFPLLTAWIHNFSNDPVIKECWPPRDKMVTKFQLMREKHFAVAGP